MNRWKPQKCKAAYKKHHKVPTTCSLGGPDTVSMCGMGMFLFNEGVEKSKSPFVLHNRYESGQLDMFFDIDYIDGYTEGFDGDLLDLVRSEESEEYEQGYDDGHKGYALVTG